MTTKTASQPSKTRKLVLQLVTGALTGGLVTYGALTALGEGGFDIDNPERVVGLLTGLIFALVGAMVGLGLVAPRLGSQLLNVEDAEELREQSRPLRTGALAMLFGGLGLIALAIAAAAGEPGVLSIETGVVVAGLARHERQRRASRQGSALGRGFRRNVAGQAGEEGGEQVALRRVGRRRGRPGHRCLRGEKRIDRGLSYQSHYICILKTSW